MASVFKAHSKGKGKGKEVEDVEAGTIKSNGNVNGHSSEEAGKKRKDKVMMLSSRGVTQRMRHLMNDLEVLLPHTKKGKLLVLQICSFIFSIPRGGM